jgi:hypothetical protein
VSDYRILIIPCKRCAKEFEFRCPLKFYEMATADGPAEFTGTCPDCRKDDPFLKMLDELNIPSYGRDYTRKP